MPSNRLYRLPLASLLLLAIAAAWLPTLTPTALATGTENSAPSTALITYVSADTPNVDPDTGDVVFLYMGDGMAEPDRREFPAQPEHAPDLPFTVTDTIAVTATGPDDPAPLAYAWYVRNARVAADADNTLFVFAGYAITKHPYLDLAVRGTLPGKFKLDATMYTVEADELTPFAVRKPLRGSTKVTIHGGDTPLNPGDLGFVQLTANPSVIALGDTTTLTAQLLTPDRALDTTAGVPLSVTTPTDQYAPADSVNGQAGFAPSYQPATAGLKLLAAAAPDYTPDDPNTLAVVAVEQLTADRGTRVDPDDPGALPYHYVPIDPAHPTVTITARPNITLADDKLPAGWSLKNGEQGLPVPHSGSHANDTKQTIVIDALTPGEHLIIARCGLSEKRMCVVVYDGPPDEGVAMHINQEGSERDDIVLVAPADTNPRPAAELRVQLYGEVGETQEVQLEVGPDSGIVLEQDTFTLTVGTPQIVNIYATSPSADWDDDTISLYFIINGVQTESPELVEDLTAAEVVGVILRGSDQAKNELDGETRFFYPETSNGADNTAIKYKPEILPAPSSGERISFDRLYGRQVLGTLGPITGLAVTEVTPQRPNRDNVGNLDGRAYGAVNPHFVLDELPDANDGFGEFPLSVELYASTALSSLILPAELAMPQGKLFFGRINRGHPKAAADPVTSNWHYYWSLEGAGAGSAVCQFSRDSAHADYAEWVEEIALDNTAYGFYDRNTGDLQLSDQAAEKIVASGAWQYSFPETPHPTNQAWVHFDIDVNTAPDFINLTFAHEKTHQLLHHNSTQPNPLADIDMDGVPNVWEDAIPGMDRADADSFKGQFTVSANSQLSRDEEFYAVLGGAFQGAFGSVVNGQNGPALGQQGVYHGVVPADADDSLDWSVEGSNW